MFGSVFAAMVCLQTASSTDVEELAQFKAIAAKPEWSKADLEKLSASLASPIGIVRDAAQAFWLKRYPDAAEDYSALCNYDSAKARDFWAVEVEPPLKAELRQASSVRRLGALRTVLALCRPPHGGSITCDFGDEEQRFPQMTAEDYSSIEPSLFLKLALDSNPTVSFNAIRFIPAKHPFLRSASLQAMFQSQDEGRLYTALSYFEAKSIKEWFALTKHLWSHPDSGIRRAAIVGGPEGKLDSAGLEKFVQTLPVYARPDAVILLGIRFEQYSASFWRRHLYDPDDQVRNFAYTMLESGESPLSPGELGRISEQSQYRSGQRALFRILDANGSASEECALIRERLWKVCPTEMFNYEVRSMGGTAPQMLIDKWVKAVESGGDAAYLRVTDSIEVSQRLPLTRWLNSGRSKLIEAALRLIPSSRANDYGLQILRCVKTERGTTLWLAVNKASELTLPDYRSQLFDLLPALRVKDPIQWHDLRESLCHKDDRFSRAFLSALRESNERGDRAFARRALFGLDHPAKDD